MHYLGFVIVPDPTDDAVADAMAPHEEDQHGGYWDWYDAGGRFDGYLVSDAEMESRRTHRFGSTDCVEGNCCLVRDLPPDRRDVHFFVADSEWDEEKDWDSDGKDPAFAKRLDAELAARPEQYVVVIDAHCLS
jgi:hypothetical protein